MYLLKQLFHGLLSQGWTYLYSRVSGEDAEAQQVQGIGIGALENSGSNGRKTEDVKTMDYHFGQADESREIFKRRERVRAKKAGDWLCSQRMVPELLQTVVGTEANESYLHLLLQEHGDDTWTGSSGIQVIPAVRLAQVARSPAVKVMDEYWRLQSTPASVSLGILQDLHTVDFAKEEYKFFQLLVDMSSSVWKRQHLKYTMFPWALAPILDAQFPSDEKKQLLSRFFQLADCCLEDGYALPLKDKFGMDSVDACLAPGSLFVQALLMTFSSKTQNVQLENNFARSSSSRMYLRGKQQSSTTMITKHVAAEAKHNHVAALGKLRPVCKKRKLGDATMTEERLPLEQANSQASALASCPTTVGTAARNAGDFASTTAAVPKKSKVNGWRMRLKELFESDPKRFSETSHERYQRLRAQASEMLNNNETKALYSQKAKAFNQNNAALVRASTAQPIPMQQVGLLAKLQPHRPVSYGPWDIGDGSYPVAHKVLAVEAGQKQFVKKQHARLTDKYGALVETEEELPPNTVALDKFCVKLGGCYYALPATEKNNILKVLQTMKNVARLRRSRDQTDPFHLLILAHPRNSHWNDESESGLAGLQVFIVCHVSLNPLDLCLWKCSVARVGNCELCNLALCPKTFSATLECSVHTDVATGASQTLPALQSMHQFAYQHRAHGLEQYDLKITDKYDVESLCTVRVNNADECFGIADVSNAAIQDGPDAEESDDPQQGLISHCMSLLREQQSGLSRPTRKTNTTKGSKEPSLRQPAKQSAGKRGTRRQGRVRVDQHIM